MAQRTSEQADTSLDARTLHAGLERHRTREVPRLERLWQYYRNTLVLTGERGYRLGQEVGLPARLGARHTGGCAATGRAGVGGVGGGAERVIENDIGWRVQAMVDFLLGRPLSIVSTARDPALRDTIDRVLDRVWEVSGGIALLQDMALLGHVYGHVDLLLRVDDQALKAAATSGGSEIEKAMDAAEALRVEVIEPRRGVAFVNPRDYREMLAYAIAFDREGRGPSGLFERVLARVRGEGEDAGRVGVLEVIEPDAHRVYEDGRLLWSRDGGVCGGELPIVHIQNIAEPFAYSGVGEVEGLIPLQDELNTRLSDRAARVTMQSFKMYLAKGIDGFDGALVRPGQVWVTDNPDAKVESFGGDSDAPSEEAHIREVREAMDKVSGVPPLAGGVVQGRIGNLSSANALRVTLMGVLAKNARKRVTYGGGVSRMCRLILAALDQAGVLSTSPADRGVRLAWPDPLPEDVQDQVLVARAKAELGVPEKRVLEELGYAATDAGVTG